MMSKVLGIVFSNMHDGIMGELTQNRTMGSVPFGGRYRLVDFTLSNLVNSGIKDVGIITKSNYQSLMDHLGTGKEWDLSRKKGGLCILPPFGRTEAVYYKGRLEALGGIIQYIQSFKADYVVMSDCNVLASIDCNEVIKYHEEKEADITIVYKNKKLVPAQKRDTTIIKMDETRRVNGVFVDPPVEEGNVLMNIVVIGKTLLERIIMEAASSNTHSFTKSVLQESNDRLKIYGYEFAGYMADIRTLGAYYDSSMDLLKPEVRAALFPKDKAVYTKVRDEVPVKYGINAKVKNSMIADGCIIQGSVENSIIFRGVKIERGAVVKNSIVMQGSIVGENSHLDCVVIDKDVLIRDSRTLVGCQSYPMFIAKGSAV